MQPLRQTLADPPLRRLLMAQTPADFADWLDAVAVIALLSYRWQVGPFVFACLAVAYALPYLLAGPAAGALVDRMEVRRVLILSNLGRGLATCALAMAPGWPVLLALIALRGGADCFFTPAKQAALQALAPPERLTAANGLSHALNQTSKIVAPSLGGLLLLFLPPAGVFLITGLLSFLAVAVLTGMPTLPGHSGGQDRKGLWAEVRDGLAEVRHNAPVHHVIGLTAAGFFAMFFYDTLIGPLFRDLALSETALGLAIASVGAGGVAGALWIGAGTALRRPFLWVAGASALGALTVAGLGLAGLLGLNPAPATVCIAFAAAGFATSCQIVPARVILQTAVPPERIGRVSALSETAASLAILVAPFPGAALATAFGAGAAFVVGGALMLAVAIWAAGLARRAG